MHRHTPILPLGVSTKRQRRVHSAVPSEIEERTAEVYGKVAGSRNSCSADLAISL